MSIILTTLGFIVIVAASALSISNHTFKAYAIDSTSLLQALKRTYVPYKREYSVCTISRADLELSDHEEFRRIFEPLVPSEAPTMKCLSREQLCAMSSREVYAYFGHDDVMVRE